MPSEDCLSLGLEDCDRTPSRSISLYFPSSLEIKAPVTYVYCPKATFSWDTVTRDILSYMTNDFLFLFFFFSFAMSDWDEH